MQMYPNVCGYIQHASAVAIYPHQGYVEKEFMLGMDAHLKGVAW